jgi:phage protein D
VEAGDDGDWTSVLDPLLEPATPVALGISFGDVSYRFDGLSTEAAWQLDAAGGSRLTVKALDRTLALDREEKVVAWPGSSDSAIAESIFSQAHGLRADVEPTPPGPDPDVHVALQRGSDLAFLRSLADKWGYSVYLEAADGVVTGHFHRLDPLAEPQAELSLGFGGDAPAVEASVELTAGRRVRVARIPPLSGSIQTGDSAGDDEAQGARSLAGVESELLSPADVDGEVEPLAAAQGMARRSAFAATLKFELDTARVGVMLRARRPVLVKGLGSRLSGRYLVERVRHTVTLERHVQQVTLVRNALGLTGDEPFARAGAPGAGLRG